MSATEGSDGRIWNSPLRKKFSKRAQEQTALTSGITPKSLLKSPSEKKSERGRKKLMSRDGYKPPERPMEYDCRGCYKKPSCELTPMTCTERTMTHRCQKCGQLVTYRFIPNVPWLYCERCMG